MRQFKPDRLTPENYESKCREVIRQVRFQGCIDNLSNHSSLRASLVAKHARGERLTPAEVERWVTLELRTSARTLSGMSLHLAPENAPMMDVVVQPAPMVGGAPFPLEVKTTNSSGTDYPVFPVSKKAVGLMEAKRLHPRALVVVVNPVTLEWWIFKANKSVTKVRETEERVPRWLVRSRDRCLESGR